MTAVLDNPVWHALTGPHASLALGQGKARHYPREIAPFSGIAEATPAAYADLAADLPSRTEVRLFRPANEFPPSGWEVLSTRPILQLVCDATELPPASDVEAGIVELGTEATPEMLALVAATKPGPFGSRTRELGLYVGIRDVQDGRLIAMGGERLRTKGHVELSAIAVHPGARGRGLGAAVTAHLVRAAMARSEVPFLHVFPDNPALGLYLRLGFRERAILWVLWHRPTACRAVAIGDLTR